VFCKSFIYVNHTESLINKFKFKLKLETKWKNPLNVAAKYLKKQPTSLLKARSGEEKDKPRALELF